MATLKLKNIKKTYDGKKTSIPENKNINTNVNISSAISDKIIVTPKTKDLSEKTTTDFIIDQLFICSYKPK